MEEEKALTIAIDVLQERLVEMDKQGLQDGRTEIYKAALKLHAMRMEIKPVITPAGITKKA